MLGSTCNFNPIKTVEPISPPFHEGMAGPTRLELAASGVTGQRSYQLNYDPIPLTWAVEDLNLWPPACKTDALPAELTAHYLQTIKIQYFGFKVNSGIDSYHLLNLYLRPFLIKLLTISLVLLYILFR